MTACITYSHIKVLILKTWIIIHNHVKVGCGIHNKTSYKFLLYNTGTETREVSFLIGSSVLILIASICFLLLELYQLCQRGPKYFKDIENYFDVATYLCVMIFVFPLGHKCWCYPSWRWQIGALAVFLAWTNTFLLLKHIPFIGQPIKMLFNVYTTFLTLIYMPVLLILTFAFPFYMLFIASVQVKVWAFICYRVHKITYFTPGLLMR